MLFLESIEYTKLQERDPEELSRLFEACRTSGLFYLDFGNAVDSNGLKSVYDAFAKYSVQPREIKLEDSQQGVERGFKQYTGSSTFEIPQHQSTAANFVLPAILQQTESAISELGTVCDDACRLILGILGDFLSQKFLESQKIANPVEKPEATGLKLCQKDASNNNEQGNGKPHTDGGLLTALFYDQPTLQIATRREGEEVEWQTVAPRPRTAVVNVADALAARTVGVLHSPLHRVIQPPGPCKERMSAVYFLRPEEEQN